uniref:Uncharacterized protein n=1 Tax=Cacopsylla melanoneura TaxID=428564 RepID=A0A8D9BFG3_9HEMI
MVWKEKAPMHQIKVILLTSLIIIFKSKPCLTRESQNQPMDLLDKLSQTGNNKILKTFLKLVCSVIAKFKGDIFLDSSSSHKYSQYNVEDALVAYTKFSIVF